MTRVETYFVKKNILYLLYIEGLKLMFDRNRKPKKNNCKKDATLFLIKNINLFYYLIIVIYLEGELELPKSLMTFMKRASP